MLTKRNKKARSPIFATLIILAVLTVLFIPVFIWTSGLTAQTQSFWEISGLIATERIVIEEVNLRAWNQSCTIYLRNIGKTTVIIDDIFVYEKRNGSSQAYPLQFSTSPHSVVQGDLMTIIADLDFTPTDQRTTYIVKVYTTRGIGDTYQLVVPEGES